MTIRQYLTDCGYCVVNGEYIDIIDLILAMDSIGPVQSEGDATNTPEFETI